MMPLSELARLAATVQPDSTSSVADAVAAAWGVPAGQARFWRSSASHVFVVPAPRPAAAVDSGRGYLRFVPQYWRSQRRLVAVAQLMRRLGTRAAQPIASLAGRLVETVHTPAGAVHAMLVAAAPGAPVEVAQLSLPQAHAWGAALAGVHEHAGAAPADLPPIFADLAGAGCLRTADPALATAVDRIRLRLERLPRNHGCYGVGHGDFELDNIAWQGTTPVAYDFDDAGPGWYAADVGYALRELLPDGDIAAFVAGYRSVRDLPEADLARLPLFAAAHAGVWLVRWPRVLDLAPVAGEPDWLAPLRAKLHGHARRLRAQVLAGSCRE